MNSLRQVIEGGGEGVILRRPHSLYQSGRSLDLVKFKVCGVFFSLSFYIDNNVTGFAIGSRGISYGRSRGWFSPAAIVCTTSHTIHFMLMFLN